MPLNRILAEFKTSVIHCDDLIAAAHKIDATGATVFTPKQQEQVTVAAFLNLFIAWETFLEESLATFMVGAPGVSGRYPVRYAVPPNEEAAKRMVVGTMRYFDYANHELVSKIASIYFANGHPYLPNLSSIYSDLRDIRTMRNSAAHISSSTQAALETLALRLLGRPSIGIRLYALLTASIGASTVYADYKTKLVVAAELISHA